MIRNPLLHLALNQLPGHKGWQKQAVLSECRDEGDLPHAIRAYFAGRSYKTKKTFPEAGILLKDAERELRRLKHYNIGYKLLGDADYPASLALIEDPPLLLYYRGHPDFNRKSGIAIVGTRRPSASALRQSYQLGLEFSLADYPVVSGLAFGIDRAVHEGALDGCGETWAVLAGGLDRPSPFSHRRLAARILDKGGVLIGEISPGRYPAKYAFPRRNRILSGLCRGCIVVQAPARSGALITADFALDQDRDLYVASSGMEGLSSEGSKNLERQGAPVISGSSDVMRDWGRFVDVCAVNTVSSPGGPDDLARMMKLELDGRLYRYMGGWFEYRGA